MQVGWAMPRKNGPFPSHHDVNLALYSEKEPWWDDPIPVYILIDNNDNAAEIEEVDRAWDTLGIDL